MGASVFSAGSETKDHMEKRGPLNGVKDEGPFVGCSLYRSRHVDWELRDSTGIGAPDSMERVSAPPGEADHNLDDRESHSTSSIDG